MYPAQYLDDLRSNRLSRPSGSRPPPPSRFTSLRRSETEANVNAPVQDHRPTLMSSNSLPVIPAQGISHRRSDSNTSSKSPFAGRALVRPPSTQPAEEGLPSPTEEQPKQQRPGLKYMVRGSRWMEQQETKSLRTALEDMDLEEEKKIHSSAQDEAAELVWKHQNPDAPSANPDAPYLNPDIHKDYHSHLRKGSYERSHSQDAVPVLAERGVSEGQRSASGGSQEETINTSTEDKRRSKEVLRKISPPSALVPSKKSRTPSGKSYGGLAEAVANDVAKAHRRISSGTKRILSGEKKMFMHPDDRIWEDPQEGHGKIERPTLLANPPKIQPPAQQPAQMARKNPFARVRMQAATLERANSEPILSAQMRHSNVEIQRNPPSQSKKPWYMSNEHLPPTPPNAADHPADEVSPKATPTKDGKELRGEDIRSATSKQRSEYSPKLPRPTMVSDKPGRPIVSFKQDWKPKEIVLEETRTPPLPRSQTEPVKPNDSPGRPGPRPQMRNIRQISVEGAPKPPIPTICVPDEPSVPSIVLPEEPDFAQLSDPQSAPVTPGINVDPPSFNIQPPSINVSSPAEPVTRAQRPARPLPHHSSTSAHINGPTQPPARPLPHHSATSPLPKSSPHYTPSVRQAGGALCAHCALPIAGRVLSAAGQRFHPGCFICHECNTNLELVAFYPEPDNKRSERLDRIAARQGGHSVPAEDDMTEDQALQQEANDGDSGLRFYCHLDFHELFSPRCKSCKTPIEGEVIVACGAEWHAGHFFCAQCGDPFDSRTPFVEKDGYAWCVGCHTHRYSSKCRKCKKPVTETVVKALGFDWHGACFVCMECNGEFEDGRYFLRGNSQDPVCVRCEERRLKA
ncbi:hypothetical protein LTR37_000567 [Vermiconidia calcicola]|uniref:Uncharacterized protein n=1 Tax=Vermiconidia calcicola TaxID=1690605 RepID=A0ACC3NYG9_9PEZI|nr:hypothetical protein LTR37_000567 [Vermiconidia calcicola]